MSLAWKYVFRCCAAIMATAAIGAITGSKSCVGPNSTPNSNSAVAFMLACAA